MMNNENRLISFAGLVLFVLLVVAFSGVKASALTNEDCIGCHSDTELTAKKKGGEPYSLFVDEDKYKKSIHADNGCTSCHADAEVDGDEHPFPLAPVDCSGCHGEASTVYAKSLHGNALKKGNPVAPKCWSCHSKHEILPPTDSNSTTFKMNIPFTCGTCHKEDAPIPGKNILDKNNVQENYSMLIHSKGLYSKGLTVTAVCSDCHSAHNVQGPTHPESTINRINVCGTCMKCHTNIENVHVKVVDVALWAKDPLKVPACVECHPPHRTRRVIYKDSLDDGSCMTCHSKPDLKKVLPDGTEKNIFVDLSQFDNTLHKKNRIACIKCHFDVAQGCKNSGTVVCSNCHQNVESMYDKSTHGKLVAAGDPNAPLCHDCHGGHKILPPSNPESPTFSRNIPDLCARCHREGEKTALRYQGSQHEIIKHYKMSTHGKGLSEAGLTVSATCTSCHTAHGVLPANDPESSVNHTNIIKTCSQCHEGIAEKFVKSIHSTQVSGDNEKLPTCVDCHTSHEIRRIDIASFRGMILHQCGSCHEHESESYFESYHGRASMLAGGEKTAKCSDCHGSHEILPITNTESKLNGANAVDTCKKCHPNANPNFTQYLTHASHNDRENYPYLFYTFWAMSLLLVGTFLFFGLHTLFWFPRSFRNRFMQRREHSHEKILK